ncbi:MAG: DUF3179 domain-containing (seleno)protein [Candidatus Binataceae bacterium]
MRRRPHPSTRRSGFGDLKAQARRAWVRRSIGLISVALMLLAGAAVCSADTPSKQLISANLVKDKIIALDHPKFIAANDAHFLQPMERLIGVVVNGVAKAYPIRILDWHEVVNDVTAGKPIAVTFCPLTGDAAVYERTIDGKTVTLSPLNKLYESDTILRDSATHSLWAQANGKAISGPEKGKQLTELASITTVWRLWKSFHPKTLVLSTDTGFARNYGVDPYVKYERGEEKFPVSKEDERLPRDEMVLGVEVDHQAEAFPFSRLALVKKMPLTVRLGGRPITIVFDPATGTAGAADEKQHIPAYSGYWFGWSAFHPQTEIWGKPLPKPIGPLPIVFKTAGDLNQAREGNSATLLKNGKVLIAGGDSGRSPMLAAAELYDPDKRTFAATGKMAYPRGGHDATTLADGKVLITGGMNDLNVIGNAEVYDPDSGQFKAVQSMSVKREKHTATLLKNGQVLVAGGFSGDADPTTSTELYDPAKGAFLPGPRMAAPRQNHTATALADGRVLIAGGMGAKGRTLNSVEIYDPATGRLTPTGSMNATREGHTATLLNNGQVLVTGGISDDNPALTSAEIYDPASGRFTPAGEMNVGRQGHRAVLLPDGDILIVGGVGVDPKHRYLASVELYDPAIKKFSLLGEMLLPRFGPTLTLLNNGEVLVTGRFAAPSYFATATAELYQPPAKAKQ